MDTIRARLTSILLGALTMAACVTPAGTAPGHGTGSAPAQKAARESDAPLAGTRWTLQSLGSEPVPPVPGVTLAFGQDGQASGNDGCNRYQTAYAARGESITISEKLAGTLMACPDPVEVRARAFRTALVTASRFTLADAGLRLHDANGRLLASFVPAIDTVAGTHWEVIAYNNGKQGVVSVLSGSRMSASFSAEGQVTGNAGCNRYFASYRQQGRSLTVGMGATTRKFCAEPPGLMRQESLYLAALHSSAALAIDGDRLELRTADGAIAVILERRSGP